MGVDSMITIEEVIRKLNYDKTTGLFTHKIAHSRVKIGSVAGTIDFNGYRCIQLYGKLYKAHRLAWFVVNGHFPENQIDHIDRNRDNNAIINLRECNGTENMGNTKMYSTNTSGYKGVTYTNGKWLAQLYKRNRNVNIGRYDTPEEASAAYNRESDLYFGEFANH